MSIRPSNAAIALVVVLVGILLTTLVPHSPFRDLGSAEAANASYSYAENGTDPVARFSATDQDGGTITWGLNGTDKDDFEISDAGVLTFKETPNYEKPTDTGMNNVYNVTVTAASKQMATQAVVVTVTDVDEAGAVMIDQPQPQATRGLEASLDDPDETIADKKWQWSRGPNVDGPWTDIAKATAASRSPVADDVGYYLRAMVTYTDKFGSGKTASVVSENPVEERTVANARPSFSALRVDVGPTGEQCLGDGRMAGDRCCVQRGASEFVRRVDVRPASEQRVDGGGMTIPCGFVQRRPSAFGLRVDAGPAVE